MYLWRKLAKPRWLSRHEAVLQARSRRRLAIVSRPGRKRLQVEIPCRSRKVSRKLVKEFGGRLEKWPRDWLKRFAALHKPKPLKIGKRLVISRAADFPIAPAVPPSPRLRRASGKLRTVSQARPPPLVIPAGGAFGTGGHVTTAMSLRLLERLTRQWKNSWSLADLGTGSGVLALAAKRFGAGRVVAIDVDPAAVRIAAANARLNRIDNVHLELADVRSWKPAARWDIVAANLHSELLMELLPKLKRCRWLILSGVLRREENEFLGALRRAKITVVAVKRRGKWIAALARC
jgi:ribosomal protein L11 methyltransferase